MLHEVANIRAIEVVAHTRSLQGTGIRGYGMQSHVQRALVEVKPAGTAGKNNGSGRIYLLFRRHCGRD